jgi:hypothetical protein
MKKYLLLCIGLTLFSAQGQDLDKKEFEHLHSSIQVDPDAPWMSIPWQTSLLDAQAIAIKAKKPLFIWAMDGHPLGCV